MRNKTIVDMPWEGADGEPISASQIDSMAHEAVKVCRATKAAATVSSGERMVMAEWDEITAETIVYDCIVRRRAVVGGE